MLNKNHTKHSVLTQRGHNQELIYDQEVYSILESINDPLKKKNLIQSGRIGKIEYNKKNPHHRKLYLILNIPRRYHVFYASLKEELNTKLQALHTYTDIRIELKEIKVQNRRDHSILTSGKKTFWMKLNWLINLFRRDGLKKRQELQQNSMKKRQVSSQKTEIKKQEQTSTLPKKIEKGFSPILNPRPKYILMIASGKGGVGKSTLAYLLAKAFAVEGIKTGLLDTDIYGPSQSVLANLEGPANIVEREGHVLLVPGLVSVSKLKSEKPIEQKDQSKYSKREHKLQISAIENKNISISKKTGLKPDLEEKQHPIKAHSVFNHKDVGDKQYDIKVMSMGLLMKKGAPAAMRGPMAQGAIRKMWRGTDWGELDLLIIDTPPGTGDIILGIIQEIKPEAALILTMPPLIAKSDVERLQALLERVNLPILGMVENMSYYLCPYCGQKSNPFYGKESDSGNQYLAKIPVYSDFNPEQVLSSSKQEAIELPKEIHTLTKKISKKLNILKSINSQKEG